MVVVVFSEKRHCYSGTVWQLNLSKGVVVWKQAVVAIDTISHCESCCDPCYQHQPYEAGNEQRLGKHYQSRLVF